MLQTLARVWLLCVLLAPIGCASAVPAPRESTPSAQRFVDTSVAKQYLYVFNGSSITEYEPGSSTVLRTITGGLANARFIFVDKSGTLFVVNDVPSGPGGSVSIYNPGATAPAKTLASSPNTTPVSLAEDSNRRLFIAEQARQNTTNNYIEAYSLKVQTYVLSLTLGNGSQPTQLAINGQNRLYVSTYRWADPGRGSIVLEYGPNFGGFTSISTDGPYPSMAVDHLNNLYLMTAARPGFRGILVLAPNSRSQIRSMAMYGNLPSAMAIAPGNTLYVSSPQGVVVYAPESTRILRTLAMTGAGSLATDANGNLYVSNASTNSVMVYAPGASSPLYTIAGNAGALAIGPQ